jgi:hypothetical protein
LSCDLGRIIKPADAQAVQVAQSTQCASLHPTPKAIINNGVKVR